MRSPEVPKIHPSAQSLFPILNESIAPWFPHASPAPLQPRAVTHNLSIRENNMETVGEGNFERSVRGLCYCRASLPSEPGLRNPALADRSRVEADSRSGWVGITPADPGSQWIQGRGGGEPGRPRVGADPGLGGLDPFSELTWSWISWNCRVEELALPMCAFQLHRKVLSTW